MTNRHGEKNCSLVWSKQVDRFYYSIEDTVDFLAELFDCGLEFRTIGSYRSAVSASHQKTDGVSVVEHPSVLLY